MLWKEYREARGTDVRSLWAGLCRIGRVLGKPEEDWRRTFVQALPERVSSQLLMVCRSEERLLSDPNWGDIVYSADVAWRGMKQEEGERKNMSGASGGGLSAPKAKPPKQPARAHDQSLCVLNLKGRNFKEGVRCQLCGLDGHAASVCNEYIQRVAEKKNKSFLPQYIIHLAEFQSREVGEEDERVWLPLTVRSVRAEVLYDTGASRSHCDEKWAVDHGVKWKKKEGLAATQSGLEVKVKGEAWVKFTYGAAWYKQKWVVLQGERGFAAISERDGRDLGVYVKGVVPVHSGEGSNPVDDREWLEEGNERSEEEEMLSEEELEIVSKITKEALEKNAALPDSAVCNDRDMVHHFDIPDGSVVYRAAYKQTKEVRKKIYKRIMEWVEKGFCKPAKEGNMNNLPLLLVDKVSGGVVDPDDYWVCIDARPLNAKNRSKKFVLPKIADVIEKAKKATMMADLNLQNAFHQILLDEFSSNLSAFTDPFTGKRYQMTNMWFGESGSATQMQKVVQAALGMGEPGTEDWRVYVDNMLVLYEGDKVEEFAHQVRRLVEKLTEKGLKLKPAKCKVGYKKMRILGHLCEKGAASIDPEKVKCFSKMERPKSLQALRSVQLAEISEEQERASRDRSSEGERKGKQEERRVDLAEMETRSKKRTEVSLEKNKKRERREGEEQEGGERGESSSGGARKREDQERRSGGEVECEERSAEERERGVQELRVRDVPAEGLREKEAEFRDLVMEAKGVEKEGERRKLVEESHQEAHEGGYHLFMKLLRKGVFWKEMKKECREEVKKCVQCLRFNVGKRGFFPLRARGVMYPMQQVHVDHLGTLEVAEGKFQHMLVVVDAATRFVWLEPVESCSGRETKEKLEKIFRVVGWPGTLVSDGGSAFVNEEIEKMLVGEGVERQIATPGAHEHNAPVERWI